MFNLCSLLLLLVVKVGSSSDTEPVCITNRYLYYHCSACQRLFETKQSVFLSWKLIWQRYIHRGSTPNYKHWELTTWCCGIWNGYSIWGNQVGATESHYQWKVKWICDLKITFWKGKSKASVSKKNTLVGVLPLVFNGVYLSSNLTLPETNIDP